MHGDFSRLEFRPDKRFSAVLGQQGRVRLDSEDNEQVMIGLHRERTTVADLVGPGAGPANALGFGISYVPKDRDPADLLITGGRYYVDGVLVDGARPEPGSPVPPDQEGPLSAPGWSYWDQPDAYRDRENEDDLLPDPPFLVYLEVWEPLVTAAQDPGIRETALGAAVPDTSARAKVAWQVRVTDDVVREGDVDPAVLRDRFADWSAGQEPTARLAARTERPPKVEDDPCPTAPESRYRGPENQLYRVEVHHVGEAPTFKWSRENGSVALPVLSVDEVTVTLADSGADAKLSVDVGDWVELVDDAYGNRGVPNPLLRVESIDPDGFRVELSAAPPPGVGRDPARHPVLRRWDHRAPAGRGAPQLVDGTLPITTGEWLDLEDGIQVWFAPDATYRAGDHWLIPARTLTGDVLWPRHADGRPLLRPPSGVRHHRTPLAWIDGTAEDEVYDLRSVFFPIAIPIENWQQNT